MAALTFLIVTQVMLALLTGHTGPSANGSPQFYSRGKLLQVLRNVRH
jgi:hypothetical protein